MQRRRRTKDSERQLKSTSSGLRLRLPIFVNELDSDVSSCLSPISVQSSSKIQVVSFLRGHGRGGLTGLTGMAIEGDRRERRQKPSNSM
jgi:hypothetical protein